MTVDIGLDHLAEVVFVRFLHWEVILLIAAPSTLCPLDRSHGVHPTPEEWGAVLPSVRV